MSAAALNTAFNQKEEDVGRISGPRDAKHLFIDHFAVVFFPFFTKAALMFFISLSLQELQCAAADVSSSIIVQQKL